MIPIKRKKPTALWLLGLAVFVLCGAPRAGYKVGEAPLYLIDVLIFATAVFAIQIPRPNIKIRSPIFGWIWIYIFFILIGQLNVFVTYGAYLEPTYVLVRYFLSFLLFWEVLYLIRSPYDLGFLLKFAAAGILVTSLITIAISLPPTRGFVQNRILANQFLEPAERINDKLDRVSDDEKGTRGRSLVGASTMTGGFLNAVWPLTILLVSMQRFGFQRPRFYFLQQMAIIVCGFATILTYARGAILGLLMSAMVILAYGKSDSKRNTLLFVFGTAIVIGWIGIESEMFYFDRVARKTEVLFTGDFSGENEQGRLNSFVEPALYLMSHPESILLGQGNTRGKVGQGAFACHFSIAAAYHYFGLVAGIAFLSIYILSIVSVRQQMRLCASDSYPQLHARMMLVVLIGIIPWLVFGHAAASMPRGSMMFFLIIGISLLGYRFVQQEAFRRRLP